MSLYEIRIPSEAGWYVMTEIGQLGRIHWEDQWQNAPSSQRPLASEFSTFDVVEGQLNVVEKACKKFGLSLTFCEDPKGFNKSYHKMLKTREEGEKKAPHTYFREVSDSLSGKTESLLAQLRNYESLEKQKFASNDLYNLAQGIKSLVPENLGQYRAISEVSPEDLAPRSGLQFLYLAGLISSVEVPRLQKLLFRVSRGNIFLQTTDLQRENACEVLNQVANPGERRSVYFVVFQLGSANSFLKAKVIKALEGLGAVPFDLPSDLSRLDETLQTAQTASEEADKILKVTEKRMTAELEYFLEVNPASGISRLEELRLVVGYESAVKHALNRFKLENGIFWNQFWVSEKQEAEFIVYLRNLKKDNASVKVDVFPADFRELRMTPPTLIRTDDFTGPFQEVVNTYGIPRYQEINPGLFTVITFPFEFGIMFGDIGHGGLLFAVGCILVRYYEQILKTPLKAVLRLRYLLFLMGLFALYCGLTYNEFLAIPWNLWGSCYTRNGGMIVDKEESCTYWLGFDPMWYQAANEVTFFNSLKMKLSIIVGVVHMILGIILKCLNAVYFNNMIDLFFEAIPQLIFFFCTFGYMALAIVIKWLTNWGDGSGAPSIIAIFINLGVTAPGQTLYGDDEGVTQTRLQTSMLSLAGICVFWMFFPKPLILGFKGWMKGRAQAQQAQALQQEPLYQELLKKEDEAQAHKPSHHDDEHDIGEIFVHQFIEVIEFVLGSISNTASYLRLWALSLAHSQLAVVFLTMTMLNPVIGGSPIIGMIGFPVWLFSTLGVIMTMDMIECFLHTLRLHWVEFQNKFFKGDGYLFDGFEVSRIAFDELLIKRESRLKD